MELKSSHEIRQPREDTTQRKHRWSFSLATVFWATTVFILSFALWTATQQKRLALDEVKRLEEVIYNDLTIRIDYGRITLFRIGNEVYALRITGPPANATQRITYEWMKLGEWPNISSNNYAKWSKVFEHHPEDARGRDFADESQAATVLSIGPLTVEWSAGSQTDGWLYLSQAKHGDRIRPIRFDIYPVQIDNLDEVKLLKPRAWKPVHMEL